MQKLIKIMFLLSCMIMVFCKISNTENKQAPVRENLKSVNVDKEHITIIDNDPKESSKTIFAEKILFNINKYSVQPITSFISKDALIIKLDHQLIFEQDSTELLERGERILSEINVILAGYGNRKVTISPSIGKNKIPIKYKDSMDFNYFCGKAVFKAISMDNKINNFKLNINGISRINNKDDLVQILFNLYSGESPVK